ncbi:MAG: hypothetical protein PHE51_08955 [Eubacteriales bacterium]|nr:hypothetical protein [Eubacteriales bacterium]
MNDYLNIKENKYSNDASASSFGWNFQANAGIFLFLKYIKKANKIKIESALQDIEITLENGYKVFAQAKSAQDFSACKDKKEKFKDAIISLARNPQDNNVLIYISNIPDTIASSDGAFNNKIISYNSCLSKIKEEIDEVFNSVVTYQDNQIKKIDTKMKKETEPKALKKLQSKYADACKLKEKIELFDKNSLFISVIHPYWGDSTNRYSEIEATILEFLSNIVQLSINQSICLKNKLLEHWQNQFSHDSTIKESKIIKNITKETFLWPVIIYSSANILDELSDCLSFQTDSSIDQDVQEIIDAPKTIYHERFEFSNKVLTKFKDYRQTHQGCSSKELNKQFLIHEYHSFTDEFKLLSTDNDIVEYLTKYFMHKIITNNRNIAKVFKGAEVEK